MTEIPPPLTKYLSTPGGRVLNPGFFISLLVPIINNKKHVIKKIVIFIIH